MTSLNDCPGATAEVLPAGRLPGEGGDGVNMPYAATEDFPTGGRQVNAGNVYQIITPITILSHIGVH